MKELTFNKISLPLESLFSSRSVRKVGQHETSFGCSATHFLSSSPYNAQK